jgi:hypothetical protein
MAVLHCRQVALRASSGSLILPELKAAMSPSGVVFQTRPNTIALFVEGQ